MKNRVSWRPSTSVARCMLKRSLQDERFGNRRFALRASAASELLDIGSSIAGACLAVSTVMRDEQTGFGSRSDSAHLAIDAPIDFVIRSSSVIDPDTLRTYAERRLAFALRRFEDRARRIMVRLGDINGPRRGVDSRCSITLKLRDGRHIDAEGVTAWPFASITLAAKRLNEALRRELEKAQGSARRRRGSRLDTPA